MTKKKKLLIVGVLILSILFGLIGGAYLWYVNSPFPTIVNLMIAARDRDIDAMLDCIEPDKANMMRKIFSFIGMDAGELLGRLVPENGAGFSRENAASGIKFSGYHRKGDRAYIEFKVGGEEKAAADTRKINFLRIDGRWYLELSFFGQGSSEYHDRPTGKEGLLCYR